MRKWHDSRTWRSVMVNPENEKDWLVIEHQEHNAYCDCAACVTIDQRGLDNDRREHLSSSWDGDGYRSKRRNSKSAQEDQPNLFADGAGRRRRHR